MRNNQSQAKKVGAEMSAWLYEGVACFVAEQPLSGHVPLYRAWNGSDHLYTTSREEYDGLPDKYSREGIACYVATSATTSGVVQARLAGDALPVALPAPQVLADNQYLEQHTQVGQLGDVLGHSTSGGHKPFYRFYNRQNDDHFYTASEEEKKHLQDSSWQYEGIQCYVKSGSSSDHVPLYRAYNSKIVDHFYTTKWSEIESATGLIYPIPGSEDVDLIVRTINTHQSASHYPIRLRGIAQKFHQDWSSQVGLIGLQEVRGEMTGCMTGSAETNGARCLAAELSSLFGAEASGRYSEGDQVGLVVGSNWRIISKDHWEVGRWRDCRYLIEALIEHVSTGYRLRFYSTHLSNTSKEKRLRQAKDVVSMIRKRAMPGELPPIVVGDFNAGRNFMTGEAEDSVRIMEEHFWRPIDTLNLGPNPIAETRIDIIYIGQKSSFPGSRGIFQPIQQRHIPMAKIPSSVNGHPEFTDELTDHNSEGFAFKIEGW